MDENKVSVTVDGIPVVVDRSQLSDFDTLEMFYDLHELAEAITNGQEPEEDSMLTVVPFARVLFGASQWKNIKKTLRDDGGDNPHILRCIQFIFKAMDVASKAAGGELKN